ncbi:MAG: hypothetical protein AAFN92_17370 [Bacteroidota bacterium]
MMRTVLVLGLLLAGGLLSAQLRVPDLGATAGAEWGLKSHIMAPDVPDFGASLLDPIFAPATAPGKLRVPEFDFSRTAPHLAFFCRLEINDKAGGKIPAKFRLGGHRYWQDNLLRR